MPEVYCRKCAKLIFEPTDFLINSHQLTPPTKRKLLKGEFPGTQLRKAGLQCDALFLTTEAFSAKCQKDSSNQGNILCPNCQAKIGKFYWCGCACACGTWESPAFRIFKDKVDCETSPFSFPAEAERVTAPLSFTCV